MAIKALSAPFWDTIDRMEHDGSVKDVAFSPDGKHLATASADKTAKDMDMEIRRYDRRSLRPLDTQPIT